MQQRSRDLPQTTLGVLFIGTLLVATAWILSAFVSAFVWASMIVISTWSILLRLQARLGGKRGLAAAVMTIALLLLLVIPLSLAVGALVGNMDQIVEKANALSHITVPPPPDWVAKIPFQGPKLAAQWQGLAEQGPGSLSAQIAPYAGRFLQWFVGRIGSVGGMILQFLLTVIICAILYVNGETAALGIRKFAMRLAGANGEKAVYLAAATIRSVAMGVIVTAVAQTTVATVGLVVASIPGAGLIAAAILILCLAQIGPLLAMLPAVIWKFYSGDSLWGFVLLAFTLVAGTMDNVMRPILIKKGADLSLILIFAGVIGGMISIGVMGIFIGPVILAVTYVLLRDWVERESEPKEPEAEPVSKAVPA